MSPVELWGGILVGGASRRMGRPKALVEWRGRTLVEGVAEALEAACTGVAVVGGSEVASRLAHLPRLADSEETSGPLAGILSALSWRPRAAWVIAACDLPFVSTAALAWLARQRRADAAAVLPRLSPGRIEPLLAIYEPNSRPLLLDLARSGSPSLQRLAGHPAVVLPEPPPDLRAAWRNVNTPEEVESARRETGADPRLA
jgi:molybdopterin-guanine dinucleotide biosynthesis protein A